MNAQGRRGPRSSGRRARFGTPTNSELQGGRGMDDVDTLKDSKSGSERLCVDRVLDDRNTVSSCTRPVNAGTVRSTRRASIAATGSRNCARADRVISHSRGVFNNGLELTAQASSNLGINSATDSAMAVGAGQVFHGLTSSATGQVARSKREAKRASRDLLEPLRAKGREHFGLKRIRSSESGGGVSEQGEEEQRVGSPHRLIRRSPHAAGRNHPSPISGLSTEARIVPVRQTNFGFEKVYIYEDSRHGLDEQTRRIRGQASFGRWNRSDEKCARDKACVVEGRHWDLMKRESTLTEGATIGSSVQGADKSLGDSFCRHGHSPASVEMRFSHDSTPVHHSLKVQRLSVSPVDFGPIDVVTDGVQSLEVLSPVAPLAVKDGAVGGRATAGWVWPRPIWGEASNRIMTAHHSASKVAKENRTACTGTSDERQATSALPGAQLRQATAIHVSSSDADAHTVHQSTRTGSIGHPHEATPSPPPPPPLSHPQGQAVERSVQLFPEEQMPMHDIEGYLNTTEDCITKMDVDVTDDKCSSETLNKEPSRHGDLSTMKETLCFDAEGASDNDDSSDGGAAHEDISAWLHSTEDWWTS